LSRKSGVARTFERAARLIGGGLILISGVVALHASPLGLLISGMS
jgi:hypothetical protein